MSYGAWQLFATAKQMLNAKKEKHEKENKWKQKMSINKNK